MTIDPEEFQRKAKEIFENKVKPQIEKSKMSKEEARDALIGVLYTQVIDLSMMSKIELGDDVIAEIKRLKEIINKDE